MPWFERTGVRHPWHIRRRDRTIISHQQIMHNAFGAK
jgi:hypothetical protein